MSTRLHFKWVRVGEIETMKAGPLYLVARDKTWTVTGKWSPFVSGPNPMIDGVGTNIRDSKRRALAHARDMVRQLSDALDEAMYDE